MNKLRYFSLIILVGLWACQSAAPASDEAQEPQVSSMQTLLPEASVIRLEPQVMEHIDYQLVEPVLISHQDGITCTGQIDVPPQSLATLSVPVGGFISQIKPYPGSYVRKGQVLAVLSHPDYIALQQAYLQAKTEGTYLGQEYQRQKNLANQHAGTEKALQKIEAEYQGKQTQLYSLKAQLEMLGIDALQLKPEAIHSEIEVRAPFSGYVSRVKANYGKYVGPGEEICAMINKQHLHLELQVFEKDMYRIHPGQAISFWVSHYKDDKPLEAEVHIVAENVDPETRTLRVHGHMDEALSARLKPGSFVNATIFPDADSLWVLPESAWLTEAGQDFVILAWPENRFQCQKLDKGESLAGGVQIERKETIPEGAKVVKKGARDIYLQMLLAFEKETSQAEDM